MTQLQFSGYKNLPYFLAVCLSALLWVAPSVSAQNLRFTLAAQLPTSGIISTRESNNLSFTIMSGSRVSFTRSSGRAYQLQAVGGFAWTQVQELPRDADYVALVPTLKDDGSIEVMVDVARKVDQRQQRYRSTLLAQPGEWLQLFGPAMQQSGGTEVYGTQTGLGDSLFLLVE